MRGILCYDNLWKKNRASKPPENSPEVKISSNMSSHAVHHLIRIASRWRSSDSWAPSLRPGHDTSGLMRRWHGESLISGPLALCFCQISAGRGPVVPDERSAFGSQTSPLHIKTLSSSLVTELTKENSTHSLCTLCNFCIPSQS